MIKCAKLVYEENIYSTKLGFDTIKSQFGRINGEKSYFFTPIK